MTEEAEYTTCFSLSGPECVQLFNVEFVEVFGATVVASNGVIKLGAGVTVVPDTGIGWIGLSDDKG